MTAAAANLATATNVVCPTCGRAVPVDHDADDQVMCVSCGENIGWALGKMWESAFETFYDGRIPPALQVA